MICIFTTAALPWKTGTAVNPTLRAAYLSKHGFDVCLVLPWLNKEDQMNLYGRVFASKTAQGQFVAQWMREHTGIARVEIRWYSAVFVSNIGCILPQSKVDLVRIVPYRDIAILEEPEHLNWLHNGSSWRHRFKQVIGVIHTNYKQYTTERDGPLSGTIIQGFSKLVTKAYTHKIIHLSPATTSSFGDVVCAVHGVRSSFFKAPSEHAHDIYFVGTALWSKGYQQLSRMCAMYPELQIHTFGSGPDAAAIKSRLPLHKAGTDHLSAEFDLFHAYVNPSTSEVLCTTTAEAIAMGKFAILPAHVSNVFFRQFHNARFYRNDAEFITIVRNCMRKRPTPLSDRERKLLSWDEATRRFIDCLSKRYKYSTFSDMAFATHYVMGLQPIHYALQKTVGIQAERPIVSWMILVCILQVLILRSWLKNKRSCCDPSVRVDTSLTWPSAAIHVSARTSLDG